VRDVNLRAGATDEDIEQPAAGELTLARAAARLTINVARDVRRPIDLYETLV
jgi:hypothetical protein